MKNVNKKKLRLVALKGLKNLSTGLENLALQNADVIRKINDAHIFSVQDIGEEEPFYFCVEKVSHDKEGKVYFQGSFYPKNEAQLEVSKYTSLAPGVTQNFNRWLVLVKEYNSISLTPNDPSEKEYENEFVDMFEIIDKDADTKPFEYEKQLYIYDYLENLVKTLRAKDEEQYKEIINDAKSLQENIQNETKKTAVRKLSRILGKIRKKGMKLLSEFFDVAKKEMLKKVFNGGCDELVSLVGSIAN